MKSLLDNLEQLNPEHKEAIHQKLFMLYVELTDNSAGFIRLASQDIDHEYKVGQQLFLSWIDDNKAYKFPPHTFAGLLSNHALRFEKRSNYYGILVTIFGVTSAVFATDMPKYDLHVLILTLASIAFAFTKWNIDKRVIKIKQMATHLLSFPPVKPY